MIVDAIRQVVERKDLTREKAFAVMEAIMSGQATDAQIAAFLTALRMKGETVEELIGFARVMREKVSVVRTKARVQTSLSGTDREMLVDTCGTGGDATGTFNVSTATAFVVAGAGIPVAKHGNRSVSSLCGSADVVEALGVRLDLTPERVGKCVDEVGIGFCYAPLLHKAMKFVMLARREIRIRTVFNILGPLTNPARAAAQVIGVYDGALTEVMANVLKELGAVRAFVVHGEDGLDELSTTGVSRVAELRDGWMRSYTVQPEDFGLPRATLADLQGGSAADNAEIIRRVLAGDRGPRRDIVLLNAGAAITAGGKASDIREGIAMAQQSIDSGAARERLERLIAYSQG
jgi:anthranilate phosphoribosyltransferase